MSSIVVAGRTRNGFAIAGALLAMTGLMVGLSGPGRADMTARSQPLKAVLSLSTHAAGVGHRVTAGAGKSTRPAKDALTKIVISWGDHSGSVRLASLATKPSHRYTRPGRYVVQLAITDSRQRTARSSAVETVSAPTGSYTGTTSQRLYGGVTFYVSSNRRTLQQISIPIVNLQCAPGGGAVSDQLAINSVTIKANGSFSARATQHGAFGGYPARFTYFFTGRFDGADGQHAAEAAGSYRETIGYTDTAARSCTSNQQTWTITRDAQPSQTNRPPRPGAYSGTTSQRLYGGVTFHVSANRKHLDEISIPLVNLQCTPGGGAVTDQLAITTATIRPDRSFTVTTTRHGVFAGENAKFSYFFIGNFHDADASGAFRAAGSYRETISYTDTVARSCTSDRQTWTASQPR